MRLAILGAAAALAAVPALAFASGGGGRVKSGPAVIPYLCDGGRAASVVYENGDFRHGKATVTFDGQTLELGAAPTLYGLRYRGQGGGAPVVAWTLRGEEGWLTESPSDDGYTREERPLARCIRVRGGAPSAHGDDH